MKSKPILINHPEIRSRRKEGCPKIRTGIKRRSKEDQKKFKYIYESGYVEECKNENRKEMPVKQQRMSKDTDIKIQKTKVKRREQGEELIIEKIKSWIRKVKAK